MNSPGLPPFSRPILAATVMWKSEDTRIREVFRSVQLAAGVFNTNRSPNTLAAEHPPVGFGTVLWFGALLRSGGNRRECAKSA